MAQISAYLNFNGNCQEAMLFYKECLGGELTVQTVEGSPIENECPPALKHLVLHASLLKDNLVLMASDMIGPDGFVPGNTISLSLNCSSQKEITGIFSKLSFGGQITHPLEKQFWGATFGVLTDKYGIRWLLNYDKKVHY